MTAAVASLFRRLFAAIVLTFSVLVLVGAIGFYLASGSAFAALGIALAGLALVVALFGAVALQIESNQLLQRIAEATEAQGRQAGPAVAAPGLVAGRAPLVPATSRGVAAPVVSRPAEQPRQPRQGRVEPVVTLKRNAAG